MAPTKAFKIRSYSNPVKVGIVVSHLGDLISRGSTKLRLPMFVPTSVYLEDDGTLVDDWDYFDTLEENTCLVLTVGGQTWDGADKVKSNIRATLEMLNKPDVKNQIKALLDDNPSETQRLLAEFVSSSDSRIDAETRNEDPDWFQDVEPRFKTKSHWMFVRAQERIRGYFSKAKEMLSNGAPGYTQAAQKRKDHVIQALKDRLKQNDYHGVYFKRSVQHAERLCDDDGWFKCQGEYNLPKCGFSHQINPYGTRENMILFSTWNLDHVIEKSRSVIPGLDEAIRNCPKNKDVNVPYFYDLLFTRKNLKLVDIRCHNKGRHTGRVSKRKFYISV